MYVYTSLAFILTAAATKGGTVEIDNLAGAAWTDQNTDSTFDGDGTDKVFFHNSGSFQEAGYNGGNIGGTVFNMDVVNDGVFQSGFTASSEFGPFNGFNFDNAVTGSGTIEVGLDAVTFNVGVGAGQTIAFQAVPAGYEAPTLTLGDVEDFAAVITGFGGDDRIVANTPAFVFQDFVSNNNNGGSLMFADGAVQASVRLAGDFDPAKFHAATSGNLTTITYG